MLKKITLFFSVFFLFFTAVPQAHAKAVVGPGSEIQESQRPAGNVYDGFVHGDQLPKEVIKKLVKIAHDFSKGSTSRLKTYRSKGFYVHTFRGADYAKKNTDTVAMLAKGNLVILVYQGENSEKDFRGKIDPIKTEAIRVVPQGKANKALQQSFLSNWQNVKRYIVTYARKNNINPKELEYIVVGHGLGGAVANIAALRLNNDSGLVMHVRNNSKSNQVKLITFGAPAVLDSTGANEAKYTFGKRNALRYVIKGDFIASALDEKGFKHFGRELKMGNPSGTKGVKEGDYDPIFSFSGTYVSKVPSKTASFFGNSFLKPDYIKRYAEIFSSP